MPRVETVEDYVNRFTGPGRAMLERLRGMISDRVREHGVDGVRR